MPHSFLANVPWLYQHAGFDSWVLQQAPPLLSLLPITVGLVAVVTVTAVGAALQMAAGR
jgi:hypothetical protein